MSNTNNLQGIFEMWDGNYIPDSDRTTVEERALNDLQRQRPYKHEDPKITRILAYLDQNWKEIYDQLLVDVWIGFRYKVLMSYLVRHFGEFNRAPIASYILRKRFILPPLLNTVILISLASLLDYAIFKVFFHYFGGISILTIICMATVIALALLLSIDSYEGI